MAARIITAGIDVGGPRKGFHAVALRAGKYLGKLATPDPAALLTWCRDHQVTAIGIDAPARWALPGQPRAAERALARAGISCFLTPTLERAQSSAFYTWMLNGAALYAALEPEYPLLSDTPTPHTCFETFPQAIACALAGKPVSAKEKATIRRTLLEQSGVDITDLTNIDTVDAALCALAAWRHARGQYRRFGDASSGYIVLPRDATSGA